MLNILEHHSGQPRGIGLSQINEPYSWIIPQVNINDPQIIKRLKRPIKLQNISHVIDCKNIVLLLKILLNSLNLILANNYICKMPLSPIWRLYWYCVLSYMKLYPLLGFLWYSFMASILFYHTRYLCSNIIVYFAYIDLSIRSIRETLGPTKVGFDSVFIALCVVVLGIDGNGAVILYRLPLLNQFF